MRRSVLFLSVALVAGAVWWYARDGETRGRATATREVPSAEGARSTNPRERQPEPAPPRANHHLLGRVVAGAPAEGVAGVTVSANDASTTTDDSGRYRLGLFLPDGGFARGPVLRAEAPDGRSALARALVRQDGTETKQPDLVLAPSQEVALRVTRRDGEAVPGAHVALVRLRRFSGMPQSPPARSPLTEHRAGARGTVSLRLPAGEYEAVASAEGFGRTAARFELPRDDDTITIILTDEWRVKILVRDRKSGAPVPGATVRAFKRYQKYGIPDQVTDAHGEAELRGLNARDTVLVDALAPGEVPQEERPGPPVRRRRPIPAGARDMVLEIDLPRVISWEVFDGDIPAPPDGTIIRLSASPGTIMTPPPQGIMRNGHLVAAGWPPMAAHALAHGPEDTMARLFAKQGAKKGRPFAFQRSTTLTLVLRNADGTPAAGQGIVLLNPGNNPIVQVKTDESGVARMEDLFGGLANLHLTRSQRHDGQLIGTLDLSAGRDLRVDYTLPAHREIELTVLVEGNRGLPDGYRLWLPGLVLRDREEDRERGVVRGRILIPPGTGTTLLASLVAAGYIDTPAEIPIPEGQDPIRHTFHLKRGLACRIRMLGQPARRHYGLQRFDFLQRTEDGWRLVDSPNMFPRRAQRKTEDGYLYDGLAPGKYVMQAQRSGVILGEAEVRAGGPTPVLTVDCTRFGVVSGHVEIPDGFELGPVRITLTGDRIHPVSARPNGPVRFDRRDGSFVVGVPGDRRVRIQAAHDVLAPHPDDGHFETVAGAEGVVLRLVTGPTLRFRVPDLFQGKSEEQRNDPRWRRPTLEVELSRGAAGGQAAFTLTARAKLQEWSTGGFAPGIYNVWIDLPDGLPFVREGVVLVDGDNDLGDLPVRPGSRLRIKVLVDEPFAVPRIFVWAIRQGEPAITRGTNSRGEAEVVVQGLIAGRYTVTLGVHRGGALNPNRDVREIEVDGTTDATLTYDLRR